MKEHYDRLGIPVTATLDQVKKAYKLKAKQLHPDVNKSPNAHEQFVDLQESYEYLISIYTGKVYNQRSQRYEAPKTKRTMTHEEWVRNYKAQARQRAENYAKMHFSKFEKSASYRAGEIGKDVFFIVYGMILGVFGIIIPLAVLVSAGVGPFLVIFIVINLCFIGAYARYYDEVKEHLKRKKFLQNYKDRMEGRQ